ncbi:unnamed protein product [Boreogadus saida]
MVMVVYLSQEEFVTYSRLMKTIAQTLVNSFKNNGSPVLVQKHPKAFWFSSRGRSLSDCIPVTSTSEQAVTAGLTSSERSNSSGSSEASGGQSAVTSRGTVPEFRIHPSATRESIQPAPPRMSVTKAIVPTDSDQPPFPSPIGGVLMQMASRSSVDQGHVVVLIAVGPEQVLRCV